MLDNETKRRIDTARDVLVGKVPDPKSQVEQITVALVYKFMDDMDKESVEMGGKPSFFTGEYKKYSWTNIFDPRLGGHEMLVLYSDAISRMGQNPKLPQLFRDIFKNAFLPYRDPETLKLFLKTINEFHYDHSERLGDAFEYLLSVLGSQGDAGQFRTPRHIIDFIVSVIQPKKNETVLDPACGTAGFLISAYKHIMKENTKKTPGDLLTSDDRKRLLANFKGYDISPDMVRLSLVNLYLHGFVQPQIYEYDTLTSEDRWNEYADVILANPPFMSPKGGIKPHKRFSVQSNRSEVLFVDYMAEHLTPTGRAGIIVPEGIIFQSANAYKQLRKYLVDNEYLWAVVSLPAGIFNPYSGVKTSILLMDKAVARKTNQILFVRVENDGFNLGAQRRPIGKNDLADAANVLTDWRKAVRNGNQEAFHNEEKSCGALLVEKTKLAENGDYNLTGDRYRQAIVRVHQKWPMVELGEVFIEIKNGKNVNQIDTVGRYRVTRIQTISDWSVNLEKTKWTNDEVSKDDFMQDGDILLSHINSMEHLAKSALFTNIKEKVVHGTNLIRFRPNINKIIPKYAWFVFTSNYFILKARSFAQKAVNQASIKTSDLKTISVPLPQLEVQREIMAEIEGYQKIIDGARRVVENWKPNIDYYLREFRAPRVKQKISNTESTENIEEWPKVALGEVCEFMTGGTPTSSIKEYYENGTIPWLVSGDIHKGEIFDCDGKITEKGLENSNAKYLPNNSVLIALNGQGKTRGTVALLRMGNATCNQSIVSINPIEKSKLLSEFLYIQMKSMYQKIRDITGDKQRSGLNIPIIKTLKIFLPPLGIQHKIVATVESEQKLVDGNRELISVCEEKIKNVINRVWEG